MAMETSLNEIALKRLADYFQHLTSANVANMSRYYTDDAYFRDPFNEVKSQTDSLIKIKKIFSEMFIRLHEPRFTITETILNENSAVLIWDFDFRMKSLKPDVKRRIHGLSHIRFTADGRVNYHRDYWDAAGELYEQFPVVGALMRWLKKRAA
jgi:steroid Delta-isomerase